LVVSYNTSITRIANITRKKIAQSKDVMMMQPFDLSGEIAKCASKGYSDEFRQQAQM